MPHGIMRKIDLETRVYKLKTSLYNGEYHERNGDWHDGAHHALNKILGMM